MTEEGRRAFDHLKELFVTAPILLLYDENRDTVIECDCSSWALGGSLLQYDDDGCLKPVAFLSRKLTPAECNYEIYDKEMLAVIECLKEWTHMLSQLPSLEIRTDHKNLEYFKKRDCYLNDRCDGTMNSPSTNSDLCIDRDVSMF
jgi:hypothetical protein